MSSCNRSFESKQKSDLFIYLFIYSSIYLYVYLFICLFIYLLNVFILQLSPPFDVLGHALSFYGLLDISGFVGANICMQYYLFGEDKYDFIHENWCTKGPVDNKLVLLQIMARHRTGDKPLLELTMASFTDAYMHHSAQWGTILCHQSCWYI